MIKSLRRRISTPRSVIAVGAAAAVLAGGVVAAPHATAQDAWALSSFDQEEGANVDAGVDETPNGSSDRCIGTGLAVGLPLLLLVPVGLASQLGLAGSSEMLAPLNAAIQDANTELQNQIGLLDPNAAQAVEQLNAMLAPFGVTAGQAAIGVGMVAAGVAGTAALLDACSTEEGSSAVWRYWLEGNSTPAEPTDPETDENGTDENGTDTDDDTGTDENGTDENGTDENGTDTDDDTGTGENGTGENGTGENGTGETDENGTGETDTDTDENGTDANGDTDS